MQQHFACPTLADAEQGFDNIGTFRTNQSADTQYFAFSQFKADIADGRLVFRRQVFYLQHDFPGRIGFFRETLGEAAADHFCHQLVHGGLFHRYGIYPFSVAQYRDFVTNFEDFLHFVRNINNAATALLQFVDNGKQMADFLFRQGGCRLIHNDDFSVVGKSLCDFNHLHFRHGQLCDFFARIDVDAQFVKNRFGIGIHFFLIDEQAFGRIPSQPQIVHYRTLLHQVQFLMYHRNTVFQSFFRTGKIHFAAEKTDTARIFGIDAEQAFEQGGFARPVFSHQRVHRMRLYLQIHAVQGFHAGKGFMHVGHGQQHGMVLLRRRILSRHGLFLMIVNKMVS